MPVREHKPQVKIVSNGLPGGTKIEVDGKLLTCVTKIEFSIGYGSKATVKLELDEALVELTGELEGLKLDDQFAESKPATKIEFHGPVSSADVEKVKQEMTKSLRRAGIR